MSTGSVGGGAEGKRRTSRMGSKKEDKKDDKVGERGTCATLWCLLSVVVCVFVARVLIVVWVTATFPVQEKGMRGGGLRCIVGRVTSDRVRVLSSPARPTTASLLLVFLCFFWLCLGFCCCGKKCNTTSLTCAAAAVVVCLM